MNEFFAQTPLSPSKSRLTYISTAVITALVVGSGMYGYRKNQSDKVQADLQNQITELTQQLVAQKNALPLAASPSRSQPAFTTPPSTSTPRTPSTASQGTGMVDHNLTYHSPDGNFFFDYPKDWLISDVSLTPNSDPSFSMTVINPSGSVTSNRSAATPGIIVKNTIGIQAYTSKKYSLDDLRIIAQNTHPHDPTITDIMINGTPGISFSSPTNDIDEYTVFLLGKNGYFSFIESVRPTSNALNAQEKAFFNSIFIAQK